MSGALMTQQILVENLGVSELSLEEAKDSSVKRLFVEGKCGHAGQNTANKRKYPIPIMKRELARMTERINSGYPVLGALDHPSDGKSRLKDVSHIIHKVWMESNGIMNFRAEILEETENGKIAAAVARRMKKIGVSSRGMGSTSTDKDGSEVVNEDYRLATFDFVADPAVGDAYPNLIGESFDAATLAQISPEALRLQFPAQVESLEENARLQALDTIRQLTGLGSENVGSKPELDEYRDQIKAVVYEEARVELRQQFGTELVRSMQTLREEVERQVRAELASDPSVAGAKITLEKLAEMLVPYQNKPDVKALLDDKDREIEERDSAIAALQAQVEAKSSDERTVTALAQKARNLAFENVVLKRVAGREDAAAVVSLVGDVSLIEDAEALQVKISEAIETSEETTRLAQERADKYAKAREKLAKKRAIQAEAKAKKVQLEARRKAEAITSKAHEVTEQLAIKLEEVQQENANLRSKNKELDTTLSRATETLERLAKTQEETNDRLETARYADRRSVGHPARSKLMEAALSGRVKREQVDALAESEDFQAEEPGGVNERVRRALSRGSEYAPSALSRVMSEGYEVSDLSALGISTKTALELGRREKSKGKRT